MAKVLVVDDDEQLCSLIAELIRVRGHDARTAASATEARIIAEDWRPDAAVLDLRLPEGDVAGYHLACDLHALDDSVACVIATAFPDAEASFAFGRAEGVAAFIVKDRNLGRIVDAVEQALGRARPATLSEQGTWHGMVGKSAVMRRTFEFIERVAPLSLAVLIEGETGTGKDLVARALHALSPRSEGPFVPVNCAAITETLFESAFFGHTRGAFTGAIAAHAGYFEQADGGTLFLDEVGDLPLTSQAKLLRVLQEPVFVPVGGDRPTRVDVRVVGATNRDLKMSTAAGDFRNDLLQRLSRIIVRVPAVRDRGPDIHLLIDHCLRRAQVELQRPDVTLSEAAVRILSGGRWEGNFREMESCIYRMVLRAEQGRPIQPADLPGDLVGEDVGLTPSEFRFPAGMTWSEAHRVVEARLHPAWIRGALDSSGGHLGRAAARLGLHRRTLERLCVRHGIGRDRMAQES